MNYYLIVSLIGSSTKNDRCQDVTLLKKVFPKIILEKKIKILYDEI